MTLHAAVIDFLDLDIETVVIDNKNDLAASDAFNLRDGVMTEQTLEPYYQIWSSKFGFQPHQSILDLLFNVGREAVFVLRKVRNKIGGHYEYKGKNGNLKRVSP